MRATELNSKETSLLVARIIILATGVAACIWEFAFWLFISVYALGFVAVMMQRYVLYRPAKRPYRSPAELRLEGVNEVWLNSPDGEQLLTWQAKPKPGMPTILYLHGNNCNLSNRLERVSRFMRDGYGIAMLSFRGYGVSSGRPSEKNNVNDALLLYHFLRKNRINPESIVVYGESLGSGVAVQLAARRKVAALVLEAPYTSLKDLVRHRFRILPAYVFLEDTFNSIEHIKKVKAPLLIVHSLGDEVIPIAFGRWLFDAAPNEKQFLRVRGAGHYGLFRAGAWSKIRVFLEAHVQGAGKFGELARTYVQRQREAEKARAAKPASERVEKVEKVYEQPVVRLISQ